MRTLNQRLSAVPVLARLAVTIVLMGLLVAASLTPGRAEPGDTAFVWIVTSTPKLLQKSLHVVLYAALALLWIWTLEALPRAWRTLGTIVVSVAFGALMEYFQTHIPGRFGTLLDVALNSFGTVAGLATALLLRYTHKRRSGPLRKPSIMG